MRIVRYRGTDGPAWGIVGAGDRVRAIGADPFTDHEPGVDVGSLGELELLAPAAPSTLICVGRNYREHAAEFDNPVPDEPLLFLKPPSSIIAPGAKIHYPALSGRVDPEAELAIIIGREAHRLPAERAMEVIGGFTCANDVTARDIQKSDGQWTRGKGFDTFCPLGPWIETDLDPGDLRVTCTVDGEIRQDGRTSDLIFPIPYLIEYISRFTRLVPGDLV
ncbi:MAG: fumarylacetoacetate hydrolase family protein, partial [Candidatus Limnocylindria bacterium]